MTHTCTDSAGNNFLTSAHVTAPDSGGTAHMHRHFPCCLSHPIPLGWLQCSKVCSVTACAALQGVWLGMQVCKVCEPSGIPAGLLSGRGAPLHLLPCCSHRLHSPEDCCARWSHGLVLWVCPELVLCYTFSASSLILAVKDSQGRTCHCHLAENCICSWLLQMIEDCVHVGFLSLSSLAFHI